jgi:NhaA family Na+:H+ antiporter
MKSLMRGRKFRFPMFIVNSLMVLPLGCVIALAWANLWPESYYTFAHALEFPVNEIGIVFFFGLMTKQVVEATLAGGELHPWRRAALPVVAAIGGIVVPALLYHAWLVHVEEPMLMQAWAITCAADVAACYFIGGVIFGRHPAMPFLLLLTIASNAIGLVVLATIHAAPRGNIIGGAVLLASALGMSYAMRRGRATSFWPFVLVGGSLSWLGCWMLGVHPALALVPIVPFLPHGKKDEGLFPDAPKSRDAMSSFERFWTYPVQVVLCLFGLVNAGVPLHGVEPGWRALPLAVIIGRPIGVLLGAIAGRAAGLHHTLRVGWKELFVIGCVASVGLTLALFFSTVIYPLGVLQLQLKCGALGTATGAVVAFLAALVFRVGRFKRGIPEHATD